jgi:hypothetical protein
MPYERLQSLAFKKLRLELRSGSSASNGETTE